MQYFYEASTVLDYKMKLYFLAHGQLKLIQEYYFSVFNVQSSCLNWHRHDLFVAERTCILCYPNRGILDDADSDRATDASQVRRLFPFLAIYTVPGRMYVPPCVRASFSKWFCTAKKRLDPEASIFAHMHVGKLRSATDFHRNSRRSWLYFTRSKIDIESSTLARWLSCRRRQIWQILRLQTNSLSYVLSIYVFKFNLGSF